MAAVEGAPQLQLDEVFGRSLHLAGPDDAAMLRCPEFSAAQQDGGFTLSIWVKPDAPEDAATAVSMAGGGGMWALRVDDHAEFHCRNAHEDGGDWRRLCASDPLPPGRWTHVAVTADASVARMFVNGSLVAQEDCPGGLPMGAQDQLRIGGNPVDARDLGALRRTLTSHGARIVKYAAHRDKMLVVSTGIGGQVHVADARAGASQLKVGSGRGHNAMALELFGDFGIALGLGNGIWSDPEAAARWFDVSTMPGPKAVRMFFDDLSA
jgi:hypothetical protein